MDQVDLEPLLERLDADINNIEDTLQPLLKAALSETATRLPLLDQAKLHVLVTYTIESILFSYLRLNGVDAKAHPVFQELTRVKQYFQKIKNAENSVESAPDRTLDKEAAGRFIQHALAGNKKINLELAEQQAKERAKAQLKRRGRPKKKRAKEAATGNGDAGSRN